MEKVKIKNIFDFQKKSKIKAGDGFKLGEAEYPFYTSSNELTKSINEYLFEDESLIFGTGGLASIHFCNEKFAVSTDCFVIQPKDKKRVFSKFVYYYLSGNMNILENGFKGAGLKHISKDYLENIEIPLPNLATQQRIAAILDQADAIIQNNRAIVQKYEALTQSLFLDMFGDPVKNEKGWKMKTLKDFGTSRLGKMLDGKKIIGNNLKPYLRNSNVQWFRFELNDLLKMDFDEKDEVEFSLKVGDLLMCEGGEIRRCAIWKDEIEDCYFQKAIHRIRLNDKYVLPEYFVHMFKNIADNGGLDEFKSAATISHLTGEKLKKMRMPIPPIELQNQFAERVAMIEAQKQQAQLELAKSEELFQSLLQRAFNGELN